MLAFKKIIIATDFSERSLQALPYAASLAKLFSAGLRIVHAHDPLPSVADVAWTGANRLSAERGRFLKAQESLNKIVSERVPEGIQVEAVVVEGSPVRAIVK